MIKSSDFIHGHLLQPNRPAFKKFLNDPWKLLCSCSYSSPCLISSCPVLMPCLKLTLKSSIIHEVFPDLIWWDVFFRFSIHPPILSSKVSYSLRTHYGPGSVLGSRKTKISKILSLPLQSPLFGEEDSLMSRQWFNMMNAITNEKWSILIDGTKTETIAFTWAEFQRIHRSLVCGEIEEAYFCPCVWLCQDKTWVGMVNLTNGGKPKTITKDLHITLRDVV